MEAADICSLPEGKYSEGSILQTLFTAHWSHCNDFHEVMLDLAKPQQDPNGLNFSSLLLTSLLFFSLLSSLFSMHPAVEEIERPLKIFPDLHIRTNKDSWFLFFT